VYCVVKPKFTLQALSIESDVPVCRGINELKKTWNDRVQAISFQIVSKV
jgi:hypothetical protein